MADFDEYKRRLGVPDKPADVVARKEFRRIRLKGATKYQYCPVCRKRVIKAGGDWKSECNPLWSVTYRVLIRIPNTEKGRIMFDDVLECDVCGREITMDDFTDAYVSRQAVIPEIKQDFDLTTENIAKFGFVTAEKPQAMELEF